MNRQTLTEQDLATMTGPELVALHNDCAASLGCEPVKRFGTKADAIRRTWAKVQAWKEKQQEAAAKQAKAKGEPKPRARRGTSSATRCCRDGRRERSSTAASAAARP